MAASNPVAVRSLNHHSAISKAFTPGVLTKDLGTLGIKRIRASGTLSQPRAGSITYYFTSTKTQSIGVSLKDGSSGSGFNFNNINLFKNNFENFQITGTKIAKGASTFDGKTLTFRSKIAAGNYNVTFSLKGTKAVKYILTLSPGLV
jgi:hypothetical protein